MHKLITGQLDQSTPEVLMRKFSYHSFRKSMLAFIREEINVIACVPISDVSILLSLLYLD